MPGLKASVNNYFTLLHLVTLSSSRAVDRWSTLTVTRRKIKVALEHNIDYNTYMNTQTPLQTVVLAGLSKRQQNSLRALQTKVEQPRGYAATTRVSDAQVAAMQRAYDVAKASGLPLAPELLAAAKALGLK